MAPGRLSNLKNCLRLVRVLAVETHERRLKAGGDLAMDLLKQHRKEQLCQLDQAS